MNIETAVSKVGGSIEVRIPVAFVKYLGLQDITKAEACNIEDLNDHEIKITFNKS